MVRSKDVTLFQQGDVNFIVNAEPDSFARSFAQVHGPSVCAVAFRVKDGAAAYERAQELGAQAFHGHVGPMELNIPAIKGIGGSLIYLVDRYGERTIYDVDFVPVEDGAGAGDAGLACIDHLTHNVHRGRMDQWAEFYERLFNFREQRFFDIEGKVTGLRSRAIVSPCGKIRIPINESRDDKSQIEEYLAAYKGEGIQHIALASDDIYESVEKLGANGVRFIDVPDAYYESLDGRLPVYAGLACIDHLTHNVHRGRMDQWAEFYERLFNFREQRFFDIEGKVTGLRSRAIVSPCGKIRIPINESRDDKSQIEEYLAAYKGEGIQHIALASDDIYESVEKLGANGVRFIDVPDAYYESLDGRLPGHGEDMARLRKNRILIDGGPEQGGGLLLQIFTDTVIGPIFFEIIQRKGNEGFGEGNFQALFEAIERDQIERGVLKA